MNNNELEGLPCDSHCDTHLGGNGHFSEDRFGWELGKLGSGFVSVD